MRIQSAAAKAQTYLESQVTGMTDHYALSICSYALTLANSQAASTTFNMLMNDAVTKGIECLQFKFVSVKKQVMHYRIEKQNKQLTTTIV